MNIFHKILIKYWGYSQFRSIQQEIIESIYANKDTLGLMPTGGGKSITFQVPALAMQGTCLVITPLVALMKDQVVNLKSRNIKAVAIYSGLANTEVINILQKASQQQYKFIYLSPERLATKAFLEYLPKIDINFICVDEAHCISQWGYDFRPAYLKIADIRNILANISILALTATATPKVVQDIQDKLLFKEKNEIKTSFYRNNLVYTTIKTENKERKIVDILKKEKVSAIIYVRSRKKTQEISKFLNANNLKTTYYNAGLSEEQKNIREALWKNNTVNIMVATNAFGMGIDKPDVRVVLHLDIPDSIEAYFQEAGRAGRDGKEAISTIIYNEGDKESLSKNLKTKFPEQNFVEEVYFKICDYFKIEINKGKNQEYPFDFYNFTKINNLNPNLTLNAIKLLEKDEYIYFTDEIYNPSKIMIKMNHIDLYRFQVENEQFDNFIKMILKLYDGLFDNFKKIEETQIAEKTKIDNELVIKYLEQLNKLNVLEYLPQRNLPFIIFLKDRVSEKIFHLSKENYDFRKKVYSEQINSMLNYIDSQNRCRSDVLLSYFGEKESVRCGKCDNCQNRNSISISKYDFDITVNNIKNVIGITPKSIKEVVENTEIEEKRALKIIRWLIDNGKIKWTEDRKLIWK